jgi:hypothetical protein
MYPMKKEKHVGKSLECCPNLKIHGYKIEKVCQDTYLGYILSSDGKLRINIQDRVAKGIGIMNKIINILDTISFGYHYFRIFNLLRESMFVNGILMNADIWYGLQEKELQELEASRQGMDKEGVQVSFFHPWGSRPSRVRLS